MGNKNKGTEKGPLTIVHFTADLWEHVCPVLRLVSPIQQAGWTLIKGNEWNEEGLQVYPERIAQADIVVVQRDFPRHTEAYEQVVTEARLQGKVLVYELDDLLTELPDSHPDFEHYMSPRGVILKAMVEADAVTCTTPGLQEYMRSFNPNAWILPNYLNDHLWTLKSSLSVENHTEMRPVVIGYLGSPSHRPDLEMIAPVLERLLDRYKDQILLRLWGIAPPGNLSGKKNVEWLDIGMVEYGRFASYFSKQECDIFIAPLLDNLFNRCKSSIKFLEYSVLGAPGIYSQLPTYASVVKPGDNGYLASTLEEWETYLTDLIENPVLRQQFGSAAQATVRRSWLLSDQIAGWTSTYQKLYQVSSHLLKSPTELQIARKFYGWYHEQATLLNSYHEQVTLLSNENASLKNRLAAEEEAANTLQARVDSQEHYGEVLNEQLLAIRGSTGWKLLELVYSVRLILAPRGSRRERWLRSGIQSLRIFRQIGLRAFGRKILSTSMQNQPAQPAQDSLGLTPITLTVVEGERCPVPAISVVIEKNVILPDLDEEAVLTWVKKQTLQTIELIVWDRKSGTAWNKENPEHSREALNVKALCQILNGRYLCIASQDLLSQNEVYLETNLIALESERLVFTVNTLGDSGWAMRHLHKGYLPGSRLQPLFRLVVRKNYVDDNFSLDLAAWTDKRQGRPGVAGKLIAHTTSQAEDAPFPIQTSIGDMEAKLQVHSILIRPKSEAPWEPVAHLLRSVDQVMPTSASFSEQPTVILAMQFLAVGGAERVALDVVRGLRHKVRFIVIALEAHDSALGTTADAFRQLTPYVYIAPDYLAPQINLSFIRYLVDRFNPETFYIANGASWIYDAVSTIKKLYPKLQTVNQVYDHVAGWINRYDPPLVANLDSHIGCNRKICQAYIEKGVPPNQAHLIENAVDVSEYNPECYPDELKRALKNKFGLPPDKKVITFISRLHQQKRPMDFVELARRFQTNPLTIFFMVGDGPLSRTVDTEVKSMRLDNFIRLPFYRPSSDIFAVSDVIVLPSEYEGMPMVILEAQAMGIPVVATDVGNIRDVLNVTEGGRVVARVGDVTTLHAELKKVLEKPINPIKVRQAVIENFGLEKMLDKYYDVLAGDEVA